MSKWCVVTPRLSGVYIWSKEYWNTQALALSRLVSHSSHYGRRDLRARVAVTFNGWHPIDTRAKTLYWTKLVC